MDHDLHPVKSDPALAQAAVEPCGYAKQHPERMVQCFSNSVTNNKQASRIWSLYTFEGFLLYIRDIRVSQSVVLNSISRIMRHHMCDNVQSHSLSPNVCLLRVRGTGAYDLKDRMQGRFTGVTLMEHLRAGIIRHSRDVLMVARWIAHGLNIEA